MMHSLWTFMLLAVNQIKLALINDNKVRILIKLKIGTESTEKFSNLTVFQFVQFLV